jgi:hypothetical protein
VAWLAAVPEGDSILVYRHMLPKQSFREAIQNSQPGTEEQTLGDYYPRGTYYDTAADVDRLGCTPSPDPDPGGAAGAESAAGEASGEERRRVGPIVLATMLGGGAAAAAVTVTAARRRRRRSQGSRPTPP